MSYPSAVLRILEFVEERDEQHIGNMEFDRYTTREEILENTKQFKGIDASNIDYWLEFMCQEGLLVKFSDAERWKSGKVIGYKSHAAELTRLLYNLKLVTIPRKEKAPRIQPDIAQVKFARSKKEAPPLEVDITSLSDVLVKHFSRYPELKTLGKTKIELVVNSALHSLAQQGFSKLSSFQQEACVKIVSQGLERFPPGVVITAGTGSGKTLGFILTPLIYAHLAGLAEIPDTKVILVYPRNALADDQTQRTKEMATGTSQAIAQALQKKYGSIGEIYGKLAWVSVEGDFESRLLKPERIKFYREPPKILVTNADTLHRRLMDPQTYKGFRRVRFVVLDEVHLYYGYYGTNAIYLIRRLKTKVRYFGKPLVLIGASATIAKPEDFCAKLFSTEPSARFAKPLLVAPDTTKSTVFGWEYHVFLKPLVTRPPLSTMVDATSCIIHNRRKNGLMEEQRKNSVDEVFKTIAFADSRDLIGRWAHDLRDFERTRFRGYVKKVTKPYEFLRYLAPCREKMELKETQLSFCRSQGIPTRCEFYKEGRCWVLSHDGGMGAWKQHRVNNKLLWYRLDNIWTTYKSSTAGKKSLKDLFRISDEYRQWTPARYYNLVVATPSLEVGIDISNVTEILLYKAIRSPSAYRQKVGRGGREPQSRMFAVSVLANTPIENYYFRHHHTLVNPSYKPIPLEHRNLDVARMHATSGILDYLSVVGHRKKLPDMYSLRDSARKGLITKDAVEMLKTEIRNSNCLKYLTRIVDEAVAKEAVEQFIGFLDDLVTVVYKYKKGAEEISVTLIDFVTRYLLEKDFEYKVSIRTKGAEKTSEVLGGIKNKVLRTISDSRERISSLDQELQRELRELYNQIQEAL